MVTFKYQTHILCFYKKNPSNTKVELMAPTFYIKSILQNKEVRSNSISET